MSSIPSSSTSASGQTTRSSTSPEVITSIAFGVVMMVIAILALRQGARQGRRLREPLSPHSCWHDRHNCGKQSTRSIQHLRILPAIPNTYLLRSSYKTSAPPLHVRLLLWSKKDPQVRSKAKDRSSHYQYPIPTSSQVQTRSRNRPSHPRATT